MARPDGAWGAPQCLRGGGLHTPAFLRAMTDLDREELRHEGSDRDRLGVKLDGERMALGPGGAVLIPPGVRHRAVGRMTILNVVVPPFDPADEWFD